MGSKPCPCVKTLSPNRWEIMASPKWQQHFIAIRRLSARTCRLSPCASFPPYGPWDDQKRLIPYVLASLLRGEPPQLSNPAAVRDYVYVDDVVEAYLRAARITSPPGEVHNVGSGQQYSIAEVVQSLCKLVAGGVPPDWGAREMQRPEPATWVADISKISSALGWKPTVTLAQGLALTADWLRDHQEFY